MTRRLEAADRAGVGCLISIFLPSMEGGGAERVMSLIANELVERGHRVDLLLVEQKGPYLQELDTRVNVVNIGARRTLAALLPLVSYLRCRRPTVLLSALTHANLVAILASRIANTGVRVVVSERGALVGAENRMQRSRINRRISAAIYRRADAVVAVSEGLRREVIDHFMLREEMVRTIYNPVRLERIDQLAQESCNHPWFDDESMSVFLAVGRLVPVKDYGTLLRAFARVRESAAVKLIVLGEGPLLDELEALSATLNISSDVEFAGFRGNPFAWMARCDGYVLSSLSEGFPNSLLQAMACGARVVSTDCDYGPSELLGNGSWGELVPVGDDEAMGAAMLRALSQGTSPDVRDRAETCNIKQIADRYCDVLDIPRVGRSS